MKRLSDHKEALYGLVVCGGESSRMGRDKSLLQYHALPQRYHVYQLLRPYCEQVFLACNPRQAAGIDTGYHFVTDDLLFAGHGPMSALLTAFHTFPGRSFLAIGCDYPFLDQQAIEQLLAGRNTTRQAVSFYKEDPAFPEPLLSVYEDSAAETSMAHFRRGSTSLRRVLLALGTHCVLPHHSSIAESVDTPEAFEEARKRLAQSP